MAVPHAYAGLSEDCFDSVQCNPGQDYYAFSCQSHIESLSGATPSCLSVHGAPAPGKQWAFNCNNGCYESSIPVPSVCPGGIMVGGDCLTKLSVLDDDVHASNEAYKIYDGTYLTEIVHVDTTGCADGKVAISDKTEPTGWQCAPQAAGLWTENGSDIYFDTGNVGIGTSAPGVALDVEASTGGAATIGSGNTASGTSSVAMGISSNASGQNSVAAGYMATSGGVASMALGNVVDASGHSAVALGRNTEAIGDNSTAMGYQTDATGQQATAMGYTTVASGQDATAMGSGTTASGDASVAMNSVTTASGSVSTAMGYHTTAQAYGSVVIGKYNVISGTPGSWVDSEPLFVIGNGTSDAARSNVMLVRKDGDTEIYGQVYVQTSGSSDTGLTIYSNDGLLDAMCLDGACRGAYFNANGIDAGLVTETGYGLETNGDLSAPGLYMTTSAPYIKTNSGITLNLQNGNNSDLRVDTSTLMVDASANRVGIGDTTPSYKLDVSGSMRATSSVYAGSSRIYTTNGDLVFEPNDEYGDRFYMSNEGQLVLVGGNGIWLAGSSTAVKVSGTTWSTSSDARLKDIHGAYKKGLSDILRLKPATFNYKVGNPKGLPSDKNYVGFIAQEVQPFFPEAVREDDKGYLEFDMHSINVAVINAIQELKAENDALKLVVCELKPAAAICNQ